MYVVYYKFNIEDLNYYMQWKEKVFLNFIIFLMDISVVLRILIVLSY